MTLILHENSFLFSDQNIDYQRRFKEMIGDCQRHSEQFEASILSYDEALKLADQFSGNENSKNINKGDIMHHMAISFRATNKIEEAIKWYKQSLETKKKRPDSPAKHYAIANTLNSIGNCYQGLRDYQKALDEWFEKACQQLQKSEDNQDTKELKSWLYNNIGICHRNLGHYEKALEAYENALSIKKEINAPSERLAMTLNNIGKVLSAQGRHQEALEKYKESLEKKREYSGQDANTRSIAVCLNNIGEENWFLQDYSEAGKWLREALAMKKIIHRGNHPSTAVTLNRIGANYSKQGDLNKAKDYYKQAYDMIMACEGHDDSKVMYNEDLDKIEEILREK